MANCIERVLSVTPSELIPNNEAGWSLAEPCRDEREIIKTTKILLARATMAWFCTDEFMETSNEIQCFSAPVAKTNATMALRALKSVRTILLSIFMTDILAKNYFVPIVVKN